MYYKYRRITIMESRGRFRGIALLAGNGTFARAGRELMNEVAQKYDRATS
jgi:hypothetical protein